LSVGQIGPVYVPQNAQPPESIPASPAPAVVMVRPVYAGFWLRAIALAIDGLILGLVFAPIIAAHPDAFFLNLDANVQALKQFPQFTPLGFLIASLVTWFYFTGFEASAWQATPGKRILRLSVTDLDGRRLTFGRAAIRNAGKMIPILSLVGYFLAGFTEKKQALHDLLARCLVLRRP
jgi:uncharacterized RDD family membrane protein YckC